MPRVYHRWSFLPAAQEDFTFHKEHKNPTIRYIMQATFHTKCTVPRTKPDN